MSEKELITLLMKKRPLRYKILILINKDLIYEIYRLAYIYYYKNSK